MVAVAYRSITRELAVCNLHHLGHHPRPDIAGEILSIFGKARPPRQGERDPGGDVAPTAAKVNQNRLRLCGYSCDCCRSLNNGKSKVLVFFRV